MIQLKLEIGKTDKKSPSGKIIMNGKVIHDGIYTKNTIDLLPQIGNNKLEISLDNKTDRDTLIKGVKISREIMNQPAFDEFRGKEINPGDHIHTDQEIEEFIRNNGETIYHPVGTCKMGNDEFSVVDDKLRVRGVENLRVVDASVMPNIITGNLNASTIMIAEKAAEMLI